MLPVNEMWRRLRSYLLPARIVDDESFSPSKGTMDAFDPPKPRTWRPPIVLRLLPEKTNVIGPILNFLESGWRCNDENYLTAGFIDVLAKATACNEGDEWLAVEAIIKLDDSLSIRAVQIPDNSGMEYHGDVVMVMYIPHDSVIAEQFHTVSRLTGGITAELLEVISRVALKMGSRISCIESSPEGNVIIIFKPFDKKFKLEGYADRLNGDVDDDALHDSDGSVAPGSET